MQGREGRINDREISECGTAREQAGGKARCARRIAGVEVPEDRGGLLSTESGEADDSLSWLDIRRGAWRL